MLSALALVCVISGQDLAGHAVAETVGAGLLKVASGSARTFTRQSSARYDGRTLAARPDGHGGHLVTVDGQAQTWTPLQASAASFTVLLVPGLSTAYWNRAGIPYMDENLAALEALGLGVRRVALPTVD